MLRFLFLLVAILFSYSSHASDCGIFRVVKKDVTFQKKGKKKFRKARVNKKICAGDTVRTGENGRARIVMADKNEINVSPTSELLIEQYANKGKNDKKVLLNVIYGKIRSNVKQKYKDDKQSFYRVKTKSAVAGVRGTNFLISFDRATQKFQATTFEGKVGVGKIVDGNFQAQFEVNPGQFTSSSPGAGLHEPKQVPPKELAQINRETNVSSDGGGRDVSGGTTQPEASKDDNQSDNGQREPNGNEPAKDPANNNDPGANQEPNNAGPDGQGTDGQPKADTAGNADPKGAAPGGREPQSINEPTGPTGPAGGPGPDRIVDNNQPGGLAPPPPPPVPVAIPEPPQAPDTLINNVIQNDQKVNLTITPCIAGQNCP